jgi:hypothetical protein
MTRLLASCAVLVFNPSWLERTAHAQANKSTVQQERRFQVKHLHKLGGCTGLLTISPGGLRFEGGAHSFSAEPADVSKISARTDNNGTVRAVRVSVFRRPEEFELTDTSGHALNSGPLLMALRSRFHG